VEDQAVFGNDVPPEAVRPPHVEHDFLVHQKLVVQPEIVAVGIELALIERVDDDIAAKLGLDLAAGEDHVNDAELTDWTWSVERCKRPGSFVPGSPRYTLLNQGRECNLGRSTTVPVVRHHVATIREMQWVPSIECRGFRQEQARRLLYVMPCCFCKRAATRAI